VHPSAARSNELNGKCDLVLPLACLLLVEIIAFGTHAKQIGVYMDEWITFHQLHFVPHNLPGLIAAFSSDPRKILRPLECFNMPVLFYFVGIKPFWYHVASYSCELLSACFLYLSLVRLASDKSIALTASILYLLYPIHDATHFAIVLWDMNLAWCFFTLSLFLYLKGLNDRRIGLIIWSSVAFLASLCEYEVTLPLLVLYPAISLITLNFRRQHDSFDWKQYLGYQIPFAIAAGSFLMFRTWLAYGSRNAYPTNLSLQHFMSTVAKGVTISLSPETISFAADLLSKSVSAGCSNVSVILLMIAGACVFLSLKKTGSDCRPIGECWIVVLLGIIVLFSSYTIFAVSAMHTPSITGWFDRINTGGSLGASLIIAGLIGAAQHSTHARTGEVKRTVFAGVISVLAVSLILINWQCAQPWITAWQAQRELIAAISRHRSSFKPGDSVIVGDINRYVDGVVVVDLPLELENVLQTTINSQNIYGTVVSERLLVTNDALVDQIGGYVWGRYPYDHIILFSPIKSQWIRISTREQFIEIVDKLGWTIKHANEAIRRYF